MDLRGKSFLAENVHLIEQEVILKQPFFNFDPLAGFECLQQKNPFDKNYSTQNSACEEPPLKSFEKVLLHFHDDHQMARAQMHWACVPCANLFSSEIDFSAHKFQCPSETDLKFCQEKVCSQMCAKTEKPSETLQSCGVCLQTFQKGHQLHLHKIALQHLVLEDVVSPIKKKFHCGKCNYQDDSATELKKHCIKFHTFPVSSNNKYMFRDLDFHPGFQCPYSVCYFKTLSKALMVHHFKMLHSEEKSYKTFQQAHQFYPCPKCKVKFKNSLLKSHMKDCPHK